MSRKTIPLLLAAALVLSGCGNAEEADILVPIYDSVSSGNYRTATAELQDISETASIGGKVGYIYEDNLTLVADSNIIEYHARRGSELQEGDIIAVFDSSAYDYEYQSQKILVDNAYSKYAASGSEYDRLTYEAEKTALDLIQYKKDEYTIRAPYDCVVTGTQSFSIGSAVSGGTVVCSVAHPDDIYVYTSDKLDSFSTGMAVKLKFGTDSYYGAKVVSVPNKAVKGKTALNTAAIIDFEDGEYERILSEVGNIAATGWATIIVPTVDRRGVLCVPSDAVFKYSGATYCYLENGGERVRVPVETGETYGKQTVILSGLSEGDVVSY